MERYRMDLILLQREYEQQNTTHIQLQANYCTVQQQEDPGNVIRHELLCAIKSYSR